MSNPPPVHLLFRTSRTPPGPYRLPRAHQRPPKSGHPGGPPRRRAQIIFAHLPPPNAGDCLGEKGPRPASAQQRYCPRNPEPASVSDSAMRRSKSYPDRDRRYCVRQTASWHTEAAAPGRSNCAISLARTPLRRYYSNRSPPASKHAWRAAELICNTTANARLGGSCFAIRISIEKRPPTH